MEWLKQEGKEKWTKRKKYNIKRCNNIKFYFFVSWFGIHVKQSVAYRCNLLFLIFRFFFDWHWESNMRNSIITLLATLQYFLLISLIAPNVLLCPYELDKRLMWTKLQIVVYEYFTLFLIFKIINDSILV